MADNTKPWADKVAQLMEEAFEEALKQVKLRPELLPKVIPLSSCSPKQVKLQMRLFGAARLDAPEAIAELQSIAAEHADMISVSEAAVLAIDTAPSTNAANFKGEEGGQGGYPRSTCGQGGQRGGQSRRACGQGGQEGQARRAGGDRPAGPRPLQTPSSRERRARSGH